jgi:hypothetical protein
MTIKFLIVQAEVFRTDGFTCFTLVASKVEPSRRA